MTGMFGHIGPCTTPEQLSTLAIAVVVAVMVFRPWRRRVASIKKNLTRLSLPLLVAAVLTVAGCGGKEPTTTTATTVLGNRPSTSAQIQIVSPQANETTGSDVSLRVELTGGKIVQVSTGPLRGDEGHVHVSLDGKLVEMQYTASQQLTGLAPGQHSLSAEFVATDHLPFRNTPRSVVLFTVAPKS